jgi:hypothetical protein
LNESPAGGTNESRAAFSTRDEEDLPRKYSAPQKIAAKANIAAATHSRRARKGERFP